MSSVLKVATCVVVAFSLAYMLDYILYLITAGKPPILMFQISCAIRMWTPFIGVIIASFISGNVL